MNLLKILFGNFSGSADLPSVTNEILSGIEAVIKVGTDTVGYATGITVDEDFEIQGIRTLGNYGDRGFKSMGYTCRFSVGTFMISDATKLSSTNQRVPSPTRDSAQTAPYVTFSIYGPDATGKLVSMYDLQDCACSTRNIRIENGQLCTRETAWMARKLVPGAGD